MLIVYKAMSQNKVTEGGIIDKEDNRSRDQLGHLKVRVLKKTEQKKLGRFSVMRITKGVWVLESSATSVSKKKKEVICCFQ